MYACMYVMVHMHSVMSDSLQPHGLQPPRLLYPWSSLSKNPGVGCHFLLHGIFPIQGPNPCLLHPLQQILTTMPLEKLCINNMCAFSVASVMSDSLQPHGLQPTRFLCLWNSPSKNAGEGLSHPTPGDLPESVIESTFHVACLDRQVLYHQYHLGSKHITQAYTHTCNTTYTHAYLYKVCIKIYS